MKLYNELEESVKNNPAKFSEMEFVANAINRLDEMDREPADKHRTIIFILIWHHFQTRDSTCKTNKLPYGIDYFNRKKRDKKSGSSSGSGSGSGSASASGQDRGDGEKYETIKCVLEKFPPTLQKILLAYVKFYMVEE